MRAHCSIALLTLLGMAAAASTSNADELRDPEETAHQRSAEILADLDRPEPGKDWLAVHLDRVRLHKKYGISYTRTLNAGEKGMHFTVRGPALGRKRNVGLSLEIRF